MSDTSESGQTTRRKYCRKIPQRWITVCCACLGTFISMSMRTYPSIAITEMTLRPNNTEIVNTDETCTKNYIYNSTIMLLGSGNYSSVEKYDWNEHTQGLILSSLSWGHIITSVLGGIMCRKLGGKQTLSLGILFSSIITILIPYCIRWGGATVLIILEVAIGIGVGTTLPATVDLLTNWIPKDELSKAGGVLFGAGSVGTMFGILFSGIISENTKIGWPMIFYFYGVVGLFFYGLIIAFCHSKPSENPCISKEELHYLSSKLKNTHSNVPAMPWRQILKSPAVWVLLMMKFVNNWIFQTVLSGTPNYMSNVLKFPVQKNGFLTSIPFLSSWIGGTLACWVADKVIADRIISITTVRKIGSSIMSVGTAICLVAASYAGCDSLQFVALQAIGYFLNSCSSICVCINALDLTPNYASSVEGLGDGIATLSAALAPYLIGVITTDQTLSQWRLVFWIVFALASICNTVFLIFGSGEVQEWNDPTYLNKKKVVGNSGVKEGVNLLPINKQ